MKARRSKPPLIPANDAEQEYLNPMTQPDTWELIAIGAVVLLVLLWMRPGMKQAFKQSKEATQKDWTGLLIPIGMVVLFVILLIALV